MASSGELVEALAATIEQHYVHADTAREVARMVRSWDVGPGGPPFAEWTRRLRTVDRHFTVAPAAPGGAPSVPRPASTEPFLQTHALDADPAVRTTRRDVIGVVRIRELVDPEAEGRRAEATAALEWLDTCTAAIIDLRGNPGGWPTMVALLAGPLLGPDPVHVVDFVTRTSSESSFTVPRPELPALAVMPTAVLVDGSTASAAESFAQLLVTTGRATLVGEPSAGAANPGDWFDTGAGAAVFVSTGAPVDPRTGTSWEGVGVLPHVAVPPARAEQAARQLLERRLGREVGPPCADGASGATD